MKKIRKGFLGAIFILFVLFIIGNSTNNNKAHVSNNSTQKGATSNEVKQNETVQKKDEEIKEWNGHNLGQYEFILTNEEYAIVVRKIDKVQDTIRFTYTFINESGDDSSAIWNFQCRPYQNGISLTDNKKYISHYYECKNEQTSIRSGYSIDDCWELIPIGDGSEIECDIGAGMWNESYLFKIDPQSMKWSIEDK